jgi:ATP-dependent protease ClpP protease subunit
VNPILKDWSPPPRPAQLRPPGAAVTRLRLVGEITVEASIPLFHAIDAARGDSIEIAIDSGGGNALCATALFELLITYPLRVVAIIERASSGAMLVALAADHRRIAPGARMMLHETRADLTNATADVLRSTVADLELFDSMAAEIIAAATGQPLKRVATWQRSTTTFTAAEAIEASIAHEVSSNQALPPGE